VKWRHKTVGKNPHEALNLLILSGKKRGEKNVSKIYGTERKRTDVLKAPNGM
jgi:hypothetical protein